MERQPAPTSERGDTRDRLIAATVAVITENGWSGVTTRSVAERAGVNPALVHYHFGSVAALRQAAAMHTLEALAEPFLAALIDDDEPDVPAELRGMLDATIGMELDQPGAAVVIEAMLQAPRDPELAVQARTMLHKFRELVAERLTIGQASGQVRSGLDPAGAATLLVALLDGLLLHRLIEPSMDIAAVQAAFTRLLEVDR